MEDELRHQPTIHGCQWTSASAGANSPQRHPRETLELFARQDNFIS